MDTVGRVLNQMNQADDGYRCLVPRSPIKRLVRDETEFRVSDTAARWLAYFIEELVVEIARQSVKFASHGGRKTIRPEDVKLAIEMMGR